MKFHIKKCKKTLRKKGNVMVWHYISHTLLVIDTSQILEILSINSTGNGGTLLGGTLHMAGEAKCQESCGSTG